MKLQSRPPITLIDEVITNAEIGDIIYDAVCREERHDVDVAARGALRALHQLDKIKDFAVMAGGNAKILEVLVRRTHNHPFEMLHIKL